MVAYRETQNCKRRESTTGKGAGQRKQLAGPSKLLSIDNDTNGPGECISLSAPWPRFCCPDAPFKKLVQKSLQFSPTLSVPSPHSTPSR
jgi:hypothetical protein